MRGSLYKTDEHLEVCPVCGRLPKIYVERLGAGWGSWCTIVCKRPFRKPHLKIEEGKASYSRAIKHGIDNWNNKCIEIVYEKLKIFKCKVED